VHSLQLKHFGKPAKNVSLSPTDNGANFNLRHSRMTLQVSCSIAARLAKVTKRLAGSFGSNSTIHASFSWAASTAEAFDRQTHLEVAQLQRVASNECWLKMIQSSL
jgi:hypothetical protein